MTARKASSGDVVPIIPRAIDDAFSVFAGYPSSETLGAIVEALRHATFPRGAVFSRWLSSRESTAGMSPIEVFVNIAPAVRAEALRRADAVVDRKRKQEERQTDPAIEAAVESIVQLITRGDTGPYGRVRALNLLERLFDGIPAELNPAKVIYRYLDAIEHRHLTASEPTPPHILSNSAFSVLHAIAVSEIVRLEALLDRPARDSDEATWHSQCIAALFHDEALPEFFNSLRTYISGEKEQNQSASVLVRRLAYLQLLFFVDHTDGLDDLFKWVLDGLSDLPDLIDASPDDLFAVQTLVHWLLVASTKDAGSANAFRNVCRVAGVSEDVMRLVDENQEALEEFATIRCTQTKTWGILRACALLDCCQGYFDDLHIESPTWEDESIIDAVVQNVSGLAHENSPLGLSFEDLSYVHLFFDHLLTSHSNWKLELSTFFVGSPGDVHGIWAGAVASDGGVTLDQYRTRQLSELATQNGWTELSQAILGFWLIVDSAFPRPDVAVDWGHACRWLESERSRGPSALVEYSIERAYEFRKAMFGEDHLDVLCLNAWRTEDGSNETSRAIDRAEVELRQIDVGMKLRLGGDCATMLGPRAWATLVDAERKYKLVSHHLGVLIESSDDLVVLYAKTIEIALADRLKPILDSEAYRTAVGARRPVKPALGQLVTLLRDYSKLPEPVRHLVDLAVGHLPKHTSTLDRLSELTPIRNRATHDRALSPGAAVDIRSMLLDPTSGLIMKLTEAFRHSKPGFDA